jgi:hypothetical protein
MRNPLAVPISLLAQTRVPYLEVLHGTPGGPDLYTAVAMHGLRVT